MPRMEISKVGRWWYELTYYPGDDSIWMGLEGPTVFGLKRAQRRARRDLRKLERIHRRSETVSVVAS